MVKKIIKKISDFFYSIPGILFISFYKFFTRTRIFNKRRLAGNKSIIFAINHTTDADPIISLIRNSFRKINIFIGEPIDLIAENIIEEFKDFTRPGTYKEIINNINKALEEEFLNLKSEADNLFGTGEEEEFEEGPGELIDPELPKEEH